MKKTRKKNIVFLVTVMIVGATLTSSVIHSKCESKLEMTVDDAVYKDAEYALKGFLGYDDSFADCSADADADLCRGEHEDMGTGRMTQRVTIVSEKGVLPISGTVTKMQDAYYPGTYEVKFNNSAVLSASANVHVRMDVRKGEQVYILTGDKDKGYTQVGVVEVEVDNCVCFETNFIHDYTISKTDIQSAQAIMARVMN